MRLWLSRKYKLHDIVDLSAIRDTRCAIWWSGISLTIDTPKKNHLASFRRSTEALKIEQYVFISKQKKKQKKIHKKAKPKKPIKLEKKLQ